MAWPSAVPGFDLCAFAGEFMPSRETDNDFPCRIDSPAGIVQGSEMPVSHDEFMRILVGRLIDELVREEVFDRDNVNNIDHGTSERLADDFQADRWLEEVIKLASRNLPRRDTT